MILYQLLPETLVLQSAAHEPPVILPEAVTTVLVSMIALVVAEVDVEERSRTPQFAEVVVVEGVAVGVGVGVGVGLCRRRVRARLEELGSDVHRAFGRRATWWSCR